MSSSLSEDVSSSVDQGTIFVVGRVCADTVDANEAGNGKEGRDVWKGGTRGKKGNRS